MEPQRADWVFAPEAPSVAHARAAVAERLRDLPEESVEVVLLLTSELVTNAVRHGIGQVGVRLAWQDGDVRVEVEDDSPRPPVVQPINPDALNGRGLILVDGLSSAWGVEARDKGKTVWFTVDA